MASIEELKQIIDLEALAERVGLERPRNGGNWRSPHHKDRSPSLSIYKKSGRWLWKDFSSDEGGDCIAFIQYVENISDVPTAMRRLHELWGISNDSPKANRQNASRERSRAEYIADRCFNDTASALAYLVGRGVPEETVRWAIEKKAVGYNDYTSAKFAAGEVGHGGPGVAFVCRSWQTGAPMAVDMRYIEPELNGGVKTQSQGEKMGYPWFVDRQAIERARTVYVVESAINALCIEGCGLPQSAALAVRGTGNVRNIDWRFLVGKFVVIAFDADQPNDKGIRPGAKATWELYEILTGLNIGCLLVDHAGWYRDEVNDVADIAKQFGIAGLKERLNLLEPWAIPGLPGKDPPLGRQRVFLPSHDFGVYWRFRVKPDFSSYVEKVEASEDGDTEQLKIEDLAGFRVASLTRVTIASATSTMSGEKDVMSETVFAVSVQTARHGAQLIRRVLADERLHNVDQWKKFGPIYSQPRFSRLLNILERTADLGARDAVNFVGLAWRGGRPVVNEGPDCYFTEPEKQCPYHNLVFPSGTRADARRVIAGYQSTFKSNAASLAVVWALGGHLKAFLGFWPHLVLQADKGSGKSTLIKRIERSIGFTMFGGQSLQTEFRLLTSLSYTSHPVGWEELSARKQDIIDKAVAMLQECYQHTITRRGSEMTEYLMCAPVMLAGEDVPVRSLTGKVIRADLTKRKGALLPENLPLFPVRDWLRFLAELDREHVLAVLAKSQAWLRLACRAKENDTGAQRMVDNYAAVLTAWKLLCEFADIDTATGDFHTDLRVEMNSHIKETAPDREPFVWILEILASEIEAGEYKFAWKIEVVGNVPSLILRPQQVMEHISTSMRLRDHWNGLPVKTGRVFKRQLESAGLIVKDELDKVIRGRRFAHMTALNLPKMAELGVHISIDEQQYDCMNLKGCLPDGLANT